MVQGCGPTVWQGSGQTRGRSRRRQGPQPARRECIGEEVGLICTGLRRTGPEAVTAGLSAARSRPDHVTVRVLPDHVPERGGQEAARHTVSG